MMKWKQNNQIEKTKNVPVFDEKLAHLIPKIAIPTCKNYIMPVKCPDPVKVIISMPMVVKLKKLAVNYRGIPRPPDLGYTVPYPIPTMEEMENKMKIEKEQRKKELEKQKEQKKAQEDFLALQVPLAAPEQTARGVSMKKITAAHHHHSKEIPQDFVDRNAHILDMVKDAIGFI